MQRRAAADRLSPSIAAATVMNRDQQKTVMTAAAVLGRNKRQVEDRSGQIELDHCVVLKLTEWQDLSCAKETNTLSSSVDVSCRACDGGVRFRDSGASWRCG